MGKEEEQAAHEVKRSLEADGVQFLAAKSLRVTCSSDGESELYDEPFVTYKRLAGREHTIFEVFIPLTSMNLIHFHHNINNYYIYII